jgi:cell wall-associated NlpC family hydrolase
MSVLRRAYVEVLPDTKGFDKELTEKLKRGDAGGKIGKQLGGQLNKALSKLDLPAIDVKANPKTAIAALDAVERKLHSLGRDAETVEVKVQTERALSQLERFKKQLGDVGGKGGDDAGSGFVGRFVSQLGTKLPEAFSGSMVAAAAPAVAALAPTLAAGVAGAVVGGAGIGGVIGGVLLAARDERVQAAGKQLGTFVLGDLTERASAFVPATLAAIARVKQGFIDIGPDLDRIFKSSRFVEPLVDGAIQGAKKFVSGFADAVDQADPVIQALRYGLDEVGAASGSAFKLLASDAKEGASAIDDLTNSVSSLITTTAAIIHGTAAVKGWTDQLDIAIDRGRYWIEDHSAIAKAVKGLGGQLDLTADGFKVGSVQAEAYRKATLGTASADDFATLKAAGMSDARIAEADASGNYRAELDRVSASTDRATDSSGKLIATEEDLKSAQTALTSAQESYKNLLDTMGPSAGRAASLVDGLRKATTNLYGAQIAATDANEAYQASWDDLTAAIGKNGKSLNLHTAAGRANRDALEQLLEKSNDMYFADIAAGDAEDGARKKHDARTSAIKNEAHHLGLNKTATQELIKTYGNIPPKETTNLILQGVNAVADALLDLATVQLHLAKGTPLSPDLSRRLARAQYGMPDTKRAQGGVLPGSAPHDRADNMVYAGTPGEWVIQRPTVRKVESQYGPGAMGYFNQFGELPEYASGGSLDRAAKASWPRSMRFDVTAARTRIPSMAEAASKVPAGGAAGPFLRAQDGKPYIWASAGPSGYDCSGIVSAVYNLLHGRSPYSHTFSTSGLPGRWFPKGGIGGPLTAAWSNPGESPASSSTGHMMGMVGGLTFESTGSRGVHLGKTTRRLTDFAHIAHYAHGGHLAMANGGVIQEPVLGVGASGRTYSFGERGPETVTPGVGGNTYNININVPATAHPAEVGRQVVTVIKAYEQGNGSRWRQS